MARGVDQRFNNARVVSMEEFKRRNHPAVATATGGGGKKPPKKPRTKTGGGGERPNPYDDGKKKPKKSFADRLFPDTAGYDPMSQPDYIGQPNSLSDLNPKNNPYFYKRRDDEDGE